LKFIVHCGAFVVQTIANTRELVGSDVNLIHRLSKNHVSEATGWRAYILLTEQCLNDLGLTLEDTHIQMEEYEHLGEIKTHSIDLRKRYKEITEARRVILEEKDADIVLIVDFDTPPAVTWEWIQDPVKRNAWNGGEVTWSNGDRPKGRAGNGASNHCAHGKGVSTEIVRDWRPFEYSTTESYEKGKQNFTETVRFEPLPNGGTRVHDVMKMHMPIPQFVKRIMAKYMMTVVYHMDEKMKNAAQLAKAEFEKAKSG
jgi:uncharacterized protein YndB with AHSA1/START domain